MKTIKEMVQAFDPEKQFDVLVQSYRQIEYAWNNKIDLQGIKTDDIQNIIISGLGGSAIAGDLVRNFLRNELAFPLQVNRNYNLPEWADESTLVITSSYSGNTEETISVLYAAIQKKCQIICVTTGGEMLDIAHAHNLPVVLLEQGFQPRYALGLSFFSLLRIFQRLDFIGDHTAFADDLIQLWKLRGAQYSEENNPAFTIAESLAGFIPVIYSASDINDVVGNRLKCQFNENSKVHAFMNVFPELNHNEIVGWETYREERMSLKVLTIRDEDYHTQLMKRFDITEEVMKRAGAEVIQLESSLDTRKERLLDLIFLCDWISYYLAIIQGKDPSEIDNIHYLKKKLAP